MLCIAMAVRAMFRVQTHACNMYTCTFVLGVERMPTSALHCNTKARYNGSRGCIRVSRAHAVPVSTHEAHAVYNIRYTLVIQMT